MSNLKAGLSLLYSQFFVRLPYPMKSFKGQTVIITGSNTGLGLEAARHIVDLGAEKVILAVRDVKKGEDAKRSIEKSTGRKDACIEVWSLDLSRYASVKEFALRAESLPRVDVLLENAGISTHEFKKFEENESTLQVNVVATFLLALMMLPKLRESAERYKITPRISIVTSSVHHFVKLDAKRKTNIFKTMNTKALADMKTRYFDSKLLQVLYCRELAAAMSESHKEGKAPVVLNFLNPGFCDSGLVRNPGIGYRIQLKIMGRSTEVGSRTLVNAVESEKENTHGQYLSDCKIARVSVFAESEEGEKTAHRVFNELNQKLDGIQPGIIKSI